MMAADALTAQAAEIERLWERLARMAEAHAAALAAKAAEIDWQPIQTAPMDGTAFLITTAGPQIDICFWEKDKWRFSDYFHKQTIAQEWPYMVAWRPLPEPADVMAFAPC